MYATLPCEPYQQVISHSEVPLGSKMLDGAPVIDDWELGEEPDETEAPAEEPDGPAEDQVDAIPVRIDREDRSLTQGTAAWARLGQTPTSQSNGPGSGADRGQSAAATGDNRR